MKTLTHTDAEHGSGGPLILMLSLGLIVIIGAAAVLLRREPPATAPTPPSPTATTAAAPTPSASAPPTSGPDAKTSDLTRALDGFLKKVPVRLAPSPAEVLQATLADRTKGPIDYRVALEKTLKTRKGAALEAARLLASGMKEVDDKLRFQHALALSKHLDAATTTEILEALDPDKADAQARPYLAFALRGSTDPKVNERLVDLYRDDADPAVRVQAGFVLGEHAKQLDPVLVERARVTARADLTGDDPKLVDSAADVLGIPPLPASDKQMLLHTVGSGTHAPRRLAALRALAAAGTPPTELKPVLERIGRDPNATADLRALAKTILTGRPQGR